jgi:predicted secreted protein
VPLRRCRAAVLLAALVLLGATGRPATAQQGSGSCRSIDNETEPITVRVDERFDIGLESNRTTGYGWLLQGPGDANAFRGVGPVYTPTPPRQAGEPPLVGTGGQECFGLEATRTGTFTLSFTYRRPFEPLTIPPARTKQITIVVVPAGAPVQIPRAALPDEPLG